MDLKGQRILLTGASRGLGRVHARYLAAQGAELVLCAREGSRKQLEQLAEELGEQGASVGWLCADARQGDALVGEVLQRFGPLDALVHNAGSVVDRSFAKLSDDDWADVLDNNLMSAVRLCRALWPHFKERHFGRIVFTSSSAGLYGNFGQANYSAAKMALIGLCKTLALEGRKVGITANCIAPVGRTEMNAAVLPAEVADILDPELISPLVAYLCHPRCEESGGIFEVMAGWIGKVHFGQGRGHSFGGDTLSMESIHQHWPEITALEDLSLPVDAMDSLAGIIGRIR